MADDVARVEKRLAQEGRRQVQHPGAPEGAQAQGRPDQGLRHLRRGNLTPAVNFPEGAEYASPKLRGGKKLSKRKRSKRFGVKIDHLASASYVFLPGKGLDGRKWKLSLAVTGPVKRTSPSAVVAVYLASGKRQVKRVRLNRGGDGRIKVSFDNRKVSAVSVTLVNGSTRYRCNQRTAVACGGKPLDDNARFAVKARPSSADPHALIRSRA